MGVGFQCEESNLAGLKKLLQNMQMGFDVDVCHKIANKVGVLQSSEISPEIFLNCPHYKMQQDSAA